jgi:hypothetical protein
MLVPVLNMSRLYAIPWPVYPPTIQRHIRFASQRYVLDTIRLVILTLTV